jgi:uncharacterized RDD family membrane protein YckC
MPFRPRPGDSIEIDGITFTFTANPQIPRFAYSQEGRVARVYRIDGAQRSCALKVFKPVHQSESTATLAERLAPYATLPGMRVCQRSAVVPERHGKLIRKHADLKYAILMPWVHGPTWHDVLTNRRPLDRQQAQALARAFSEVLVGLEQRGVAHCDLSAPNVLLPMLEASSGATTQVELVDVEQLYSPDLPETDRSMAGSPGYAHATAASGIWEQAGDRFAGAILLAEMMTWSNPRIRDAAAGDSYFEPGELQRDSQRYRVLRAALSDEWGDQTAVLLDRVWQSRTLRECPTASEWAAGLQRGSSAMGMAGGYGREAAFSGSAGGAGDPWGQAPAWGAQQATGPSDPWGSPASQNDPWSAPSGAGGPADPWSGPTPSAGPNDPWGTPGASAGQHDPWGAPAASAGQNDAWGTPATPAPQNDPWAGAGSSSGAADDPWGMPATINPWSNPPAPPAPSSDADSWATTGPDPRTGSTDPWAGLAWNPEQAGAYSDPTPSGSGARVDPYGVQRRVMSAPPVGPRPAYRPATGISRGAALAVDLVLSSLLCVALGLLIALPLKISYIVPALLIWLAYYTVSWTVVSATPGQILFGLRVVDAHSSLPLTFWQSIVRCTAYVLSLASFGVGFFMGLRELGAPSLPDWLARTRVVATE